MNKQEIITVLSELYKISGFRISLHGTDYTEIAAFPEEPLPFCRLVNGCDSEHALCLECDRHGCEVAVAKRGTYIYKCRYGLTEAISPLYNFGTMTGFLMMGQIADGEGAIDCARELAGRVLGDNTEALAESIPKVAPDMIESYVRIMTICAEYLTLSNAMPSAKPTVAELARQYISENLSKKFSISDICDKLGTSKSTLLTSFKKHFGTTVNAYITETRLDTSLKLLEEGAKTINEIATEVGFADQSYFSKVFSQRYGMPPSEYRLKIKVDEGDE